MTGSSSGRCRYRATGSGGPFLKRSDDRLSSGGSCLYKAHASNGSQLSSRGFSSTGDTHRSGLGTLHFLQNLTPPFVLFAVTLPPSNASDSRSPLSNASRAFPRISDIPIPSSSSSAPTRAPLSSGLPGGVNQAEK